MSAARSKKQKEPKFEEAIESLEEMLEQIETGELGLEESIEKYGEGMELIKTCRGILDRAAKRMAELVPDDAGNLEVEEHDEVADEDDDEQ